MSRLFDLTTTPIPASPGEWVARGLSDGAFPRRDARRSFDLMAHEPATAGASTAVSRS